MMGVPESWKINIYFYIFFFHLNQTYDMVDCEA